MEDTRGSSSAAPKRRRPKAAKSGQPVLVCPECGRTFGRPAAMGAHRRRAHGVVGATAGTRSRAKRTAQPGSGSTNAAGVDRDALLQALFPNGVPAREDVIRAVSQLLDEAERLTRLR